MTARAKVPANLKSPEASRQKLRKSATGKETGSLSPVDRMQRKFSYIDSELSRRIISDPSLEFARALRSEWTRELSHEKSCTNPIIIHD